MKHLLNNLSEEEKNSIRNQYTGSMKVVTENFKKLLNSKLGDVRPLVDNESHIEEVLIGEQKLVDFFNNLFSGKKDKETEIKIDDPKKADLVDDDVAKFYKTLESIKEPVSQQQRGKMNFQQKVETVQIALQLLGYELPKFGVDGLFGSETSSAVIKFKTDNKLNEYFKRSNSNLNESLPQIDTFPIAGGQYNIGYDKEWDDFSNPAGTANSDFSTTATNAGAGGHKNGHIGIDIFGKRGTPIVAPVDGKVDYGGNGLTVIVQDDKTGFSHWLGHLDSITVKKGEFVSAGQQVGTLGNTGNAAGTAPHLHYNIYKTSSGFNSGQNPLDILKGAINKSTTTPIKKKGDDSEIISQSNEIGGVSVTPEMIKVMIDKLKSKGVKSEDLKKYLDIVNTGGGEGFTDIDLISDEGYKKYESICQKFISTKSSNLLGITGGMMAKAAKTTYGQYQKYVPPQLALAQLTIEGGFSSNPNSRPIKTKNPYNVGNVDNGSNKYFSNVEDSIQVYYDLIAKSYLTGGKTASDLINNFVNKNNNRYASAPNYENSLNTLINQINNA